MTELIVQYASWLLAMAILACGSAFCSGSEAALFYLGTADRRRLAAGGRAQRIVAKLLETPERLLTSILFGNLAMNLAYFVIASVVSVELDHSGRSGEAGVFALASLMLLIFFGEVLPKSLAVIRPMQAAAAVAIPLTFLVRLVEPLLPVFRVANVLARRLLWPGFEPEPYLRVSDLERAVRLSESNVELVDQERNALERLVSLSEIRADELMRPRVQFRVFRPPVALAALAEWEPPSGYVLVSEPDGDEVVAAVPLKRLSSVPSERLEQLAEPVVYVPWSTTAAAALEALRREGRQVAAVVNEFGETIGILTLDDILDTVFSRDASRSQRFFKRLPIRQVSLGVWHVTGMTSVRRLVRHFNVPWPPTKSVTVSGVVQEVLERLPVPGDQCQWGPFHFRVIDSPDRGQILVELTLTPEEPS